MDFRVAIDKVRWTFLIYSFKLEDGACPLFCSEVEFSGRVVAGVLFVEYEH